MPQGRLIVAGKAAAAVLAAAAGLATPAEAQTRSFGWEAAIGHEHISAPLVRLDDQSPVIRIDGLTRLSGAHLAGAASGMRDWPSAGGALALAGRIELKHAPSARDLAFGALSLDAMQRWTLPGLTLGIGPSLQRFWVAGRPFRASAGLQAEATLAAGDDGHTVAFFNVARHRHDRAFAELDAHAAGLTLQRRWALTPGPVKALDLEAGAGRERTLRQRPELASRQWHLRAGAEAAFAGIDWNLGLMVQRARFDAPLLDGLPARRDRFRALELGTAVDIGAGLVVKLGWTASRNAANLALYQSRQRQWSLTLATRTDGAAAAAPPQ